MLSDGLVGLRDWDVRDADWYAATAANDELIQEFTTESPTVTADEVRSAIADLAGQPDAVGFLICDALTGQRLGNLALEIEDGVGHVSYWLAASARGRGVATRAVRLLSAWAFASRRLRELRLWARTDNISSRQVAERAGFQRDPRHDEQKPVKGAVWDNVAYVLPAPDPRPTLHNG